jgi:hypothetical protein
VTPLMSLSKWFYDTSTGAATGAVPLWFPRPEVKGVVLLCLSARLRSSLFSPSVRVCGVPEFIPCDCRLPGPFIAQGRTVTG